MNKHSTGSKKFNFNDIDQESQQAMSVQKPKPKKSKRSYNFSLLDDSDDDQAQSNIGKPPKETAQAQIPSEKDDLIRDTAEEEINEQGSQISAALEKEKKMQQQRDKCFMQQLLTAIIHLKEEKILNQLLQLSKQKKISFIQTSALLYLLLKETFKNPCNYFVEENYKQVVVSRAPIVVDELILLRKWGVYSLRSLGQEVSKVIEKRRAPKRLGKLAEHRVKQLAEQFEQVGNYDDCLAVCSIEDMAFRESYEFSSSKEMRNEFSVISSGALKTIPHTVWLVDLSLALLYFDPISLEDHMKDLNKKYAKSPQAFMAPHFLLLNLKKGSPHSLNHVITQIVGNSPKQLDGLNQILFMWAFNSHSKRTISEFEKAIHKIIKQIQSPPLFVDFLCYLQPKSHQVKAYFDFYLLENSSLKSKKDEKLEQMKTYITKREWEMGGADSPTLQILVKWVKCQKFLHESDKIVSLKYLVSNFKWLSSTVIHSSAEVYQAMIDSILTFELVCTYKSEKKRELIEVLMALHKVLNREQEKLIINGIIAFIELKSKVFWLFKQERFLDLHHLFGVLEDRENGGDDSSKRIKLNLIKALSNSLQSLQGELYMQQLYSRFEKPLSLKIAKIIDNPQCSEVSGPQKALLLDNPLIKLATMLKTVPKFTHRVIMNLLL